MSAEPSPAAAAEQQEESKGSALWREIKGLLWVLIAVLAFHSLIAKPFYIPSESMMPGLLTGDRLVVSELSRLGRSLGQVIRIVDELVKQKVRFIAIKEAIRFEGKQDMPTKVMVALFGLFAEVERDLISQRTVPLEYGTTQMYVNGSDMTNSGYDLSLRVIPVKTRDWLWSLQFNTSVNKNSVVKPRYTPTIKTLTNGTALVNGYPIDGFWSFPFSSPRYATSLSLNCAERRKSITYASPQATE